MPIVKKLKHLVPKGARPLLAKSYHRWLARESRVEKGKRDVRLGMAPNDDEAEVLEKVSCRIHPDDGMYIGDAGHYFSVGLSAMRCLTAVMDARRDPIAIRRALDMPSGFGRELRFFVHFLPRATFTACDIIREGVEFCAAEFGAEAEYSLYDIGALSFEQPFDIIWCGSLITHLSDHNISALLRLFAKSLTPGGVAVLTTAGDHSFDRLKTEPALYGLSPNDIDLLRASYADSGFGFRPYPRHDEPVETSLMEDDYGITLTSPEWLRRRVAEVGGLREIYFGHRGWDDHLDVYGFVKA